MLANNWALSFLKHANAPAGGGGLPGSGVDVVMAVKEFDTGTATSTLDITTSDLGGRTPKAVIMVLTGHQAANDPSDTNGALLGVGFAASSSSDFAIFARSDNNLASTDVSRAMASELMRFYGTTGTVPTKLLTLSAFITNGARITRTINDGSSLRGFCIFFAGSDFSASAAMVNLGSSTSAVTVSGLAFAPEAVMVISAASASGLGRESFYTLSVGLATSDGTQRCLSQVEADGAAAGDPRAILYNNKIAVQITSSTGAIAYNVTIGNFDSDGFDLTPSASTSNDDVMYLAMNFGGALSKIVDITTPTSTGASTISGAGFAPGGVLALLSSIETANTTPSSADAKYSGFGISAFTESAAWAANVRLQSAADPTATRTNVKSNALLGATSTSTAAIVASLTAFTSDGLTLNYSAVDAAAKLGFALLVERP